MTAAMRVAHFIPYSGRAQGGPVQVLSCYTREQVKAGLEVHLFSVARGNDGPQMDFDPRVKIHTSSDARLGSYRYSPELHGRAVELQADVIHSHCLFMDVNRLAAQVAGRLKVPHLIAPCGHLQEGALERSSWKKWIATTAFQGRALREATAYQAKSEPEYKGMRAYGLKGPIVLFPNPVEAPAADLHYDSGGFREKFGLPEDKRLLLYLGRIHPVKGTMRLVDAWAQLRQFHDEWQLVLAGPDEGGFQREVERRILEHGTTDSISFTGSVRGDDKWNAYAAAELFVMPSDYENFGVSVAEALLLKKPVVTTNRTPWEPLIAAGAGWWVERSPEAISEALREGLAKPPSALTAMGENALKLSSAFSVETVGRQVIETYEWLLGRRPQPDFVMND